MTEQGLESRVVLFIWTKTVVLCPLSLPERTVGFANSFGAAQAPEVKSIAEQTPESAVPGIVA
jgi:hypothetical protein